MLLGFCVFLSKSSRETIRNDFKALNLTDKVVLDQTEWKRKIHIADPNYWDQYIEQLKKKKKKKGSKLLLLLSFPIISCGLGLGLELPEFSCISYVYGCCRYPL